MNYVSGRLIASVSSGFRVQKHQGFHPNLCRWGCSKIPIERCTGKQSSKRGTKSSQKFSKSDVSVVLWACSHSAVRFVRRFFRSRITFLALIACCFPIEPASSQTPNAHRASALMSLSSLTLFVETYKRPKLPTRVTFSMSNGE